MTAAATLDLSYVRPRLRSGRSVAKRPDTELRALVMLELTAASLDPQRMGKRHIIIAGLAKPLVLDVAGENREPARANHRLRQHGYRVIRIRSVAEVGLALTASGIAIRRAA